MAKTGKKPEILHPSCEARIELACRRECIFHVFEKPDSLSKYRSCGQAVGFYPLLGGGPAADPPPVRSHSSKAVFRGRSFPPCGYRKKWAAAGVFFRYLASHPKTKKKPLPLPAKLFAWLVGGASGGLPACQRQPDSQPDVVSQAPRGQSAWAGMNPKRGAWMNPKREAWWGQGRPGPKKVTFFKGK